VIKLIMKGLYFHMRTRVHTRRRHRLGCVWYRCMCSWSIDISAWSRSPLQLPGQQSTCTAPRA